MTTSPQSPAPSNDPSEPHPGPASSPQPGAAHDPLTSRQFPATITIAGGNLESYEMLKKLYGLDDSEIASEAIQVVIMMQRYQILKPRGGLAKNFFDQVAALKVLRDRIISGLANVHSATSLASAAFTQLMHAAASHPGAVQPPPAGSPNPKN